MRRVGAARRGASNRRAEARARKGTHASSPTTSPPAPARAESQDVKVPSPHATSRTRSPGAIGSVSTKPFSSSCCARWSASSIGACPGSVRCAPSGSGTVGEALLPSIADNEAWPTPARAAHAPQVGASFCHRASISERADARAAATGSRSYPRQTLSSAPRAARPTRPRSPRRTGPSPPRGSRACRSDNDSGAACSGCGRRNRA